jgi:hypothetical protein
MGKKSRVKAAGRTALLDAAPVDVPVVGGREPCPCGSGRRYKACHGQIATAGSVPPSTRPFEGLPAECDWVAMREIVPAATAQARLLGQQPVAEITVSTVLPMAWPAMHRADGTVFLGLQTTVVSGDPGLDLGRGLRAALALEPGNPVPDLPPLRAGGPATRLQDLIDPDGEFEVQLHDGFDFWMDAAAELTPEVRESLERANSAVVPTARLSSVPAAYWCQIGERRHLRWVLPDEEEGLLDGIARLHAAGDSAVMPGSRYIGAFRAHGLVVPVWDLDADTEAAALEEPVAAFRARLAEAIADDSPLTPQQRQARAGVVSRQLTLR